MRPGEPLSLTSLPGGESEESANPYFANLLQGWLTGAYFTDEDGKANPQLFEP